MNDFRKEKLRITNLYHEINERGIADLSLDFGRVGSIPLTLTRWRGNEIVEVWYAYSSGGLEQLQNIHKELRDIYREALAQREQVAA